MCPSALIFINCSYLSKKEKKKECITKPRLSVAINGTLVGYFEGGRGLKQGDPISPYLFVIAMEDLFKILAEATLDTKRFEFHLRCSKL